MLHLFILAVTTLLLCAGIMTTASTQEPPKHHCPEGFCNPWPSASDEQKRFGDFLRWRWQRWRHPLPAPNPKDFPLASNNPTFLQENRQIPTLTWIGHATFLLQQAGINILTDPHFSERASPVSWAGPKRIVPPGLSLEQLPRIDVVLISHNHYDSLDVTSLKALRQRPGGDLTTFLVPLGLKGWFADLHIDRVTELDWWKEHQVGNVRFVALPAKHWSKRTFFDTRKTLWASWASISPHFNAYFSGDTGMAPHFKEIGSRFGSFDVAMIPIGAYEPRWFMKGSHINPQEAVTAHQQLNSRLSVAMHWGTFQLTDEPLTEPPKLLATALTQAKLSAEDFRVLRHGETLHLKQ